MCHEGMGHGAICIWTYLPPVINSPLSDCSIIAAQTLLLETVLSAECRVCIPWPVMFSRMTLLLLLPYLWRWRQGFHLGGVMWL